MNIYWRGAVGEQACADVPLGLRVHELHPEGDLPLLTALLACAALSSGGAWAQEGPVATACKDDIPKLCAGKEHGEGEVRACLEANKEKVSAACKTALETTGPGKGMGQGKSK